MSLSLPADPAATIVQDEKRVLRKAAKAARAGAAAAQADAGQILCRRFPAKVPLAAGAIVSGYWPLGDEIDPRPLMEALRRRGHPLALPVIRAAGEPLDFRVWLPGDPLEAAGFGTHQPLARAGEVQPRILLVPLLAFDAAGYRLGYGGGFYDRTLALLRRLGDTLAVGLAYAAQQVPAVPREATDQPLDLVVTELGLIGPAA